jgi:hypothetical protein
VSSYEAFLESKRHSKKPKAKELVYAPSQLFDFQRFLVEWSLGEVRSAIFADTGMGKTLMQLTWAKNVNLMTGKPVLVLAPLVVAYQTAKEAEKFGIEGATVSRDGSVPGPIVVTNYEQLSKFSYGDFGGVVCDESGILKSFDGQTRNAIIQFMRKVDYRLLCSATPAPNDYVELGSSAEALGIMGQTTMLSKFFTNGRDNCSERRHYGKAPKWQFRGHSEKPFWQWVSSWARIIRKPSDLGFDDSRYVMPELITNLHKVEAGAPEGMLFALPATRLDEQRKETKRTVRERCERVSELVNHDQSFLVWCNRNDESLLLKSFIPDAVEVSGSDKDEAKIDKIMAFVNGDVRGLITKPSIGAWGLNFQHCAHMTYFPNHSYEEWYQSIRRCLRYGQQNDVTVDVVYCPGEQKILDNMVQKGRKADQMYAQLVAHMNNPISFGQKQINEVKELPSWLAS